MVKEVTINHLYCKLSASALFNILCNPVMFGPNVELDVQPAFSRILLGNSTEEAECDVVV